MGDYTHVKKNKKEKGVGSVIIIMFDDMDLTIDEVREFPA